VLDSPREHIPLHGPQRMLFAVDDQHLRPAKDEAELFVLVAVRRDGRARGELDQIQHRALAEERARRHTGRELELPEVLEVDELRLHGAIVRFVLVTHHREEFRVDGLAEPISHYTDAVRSSGLLFLSGIVPVDVEGKLVGEGDVVEQTRQVFRNMELVLRAAGCTFADVVKVTNFLLDVNHRAAINPVRQEFFGDARPASTLVEVAALAVPGALLEIEAVAAIPS
jgi:2-iminobutanoate/2-iminopropanoate deaminase